MPIACEWDPKKHERNIRIRGFGFDKGALIFHGRCVIKEIFRHDYDETRIKAIGEVDGNILTVIYTDRGNVRRIISARPASRKERKEYGQEMDAHDA